MTLGATPRRPILRGYVDEFGDRGCGPKSSPFFGFACVLIADEDDHLLRGAVDQVRTDLKVGNPMSWKDHAKVFPRRQCAIDTLLGVPRTSVIYVLVEKANIPTTAGMFTDQVLFYNFAAAMVMERALLAAKYWSGGTRDLLMRFGHVRGFDHTTTHAYFAYRNSIDPSWIPWHLLRGGAVEFVGQAAWDGLQAADAYAGALHTALRPNSYGGYEEHHFLKVRPIMRRGPQGAVWKYGFKLLGDDSTLTSMPWWPADGL